MRYLQFREHDLNIEMTLSKHNVNVCIMPFVFEISSVQDLSKKQNSRFALMGS